MKKKSEIDLKGLIQTGSLIELYLGSAYSEDDEVFSVGRIVDSDEKYFIFESLDSAGRLDSYQTRPIESIGHISESSDYLNLLCLYSEQCKKLNAYNSFGLEYDTNTISFYYGDLMDRTIQYALNKKSACTILASDKDYLITGQTITYGKDSAIGICLIDFENIEKKRAILQKKSKIISFDFESVTNTIMDSISESFIGMRSV